MPQSDAARTTGTVAEYRDTLRCARLLVDTAMANVVSLSAAPSVWDALPDFFASLARALQYDRAYILETLPAGENRPSHALLFDWTDTQGALQPPASAPPISRTDSPEILEWMLPLTRGESVITQRDTAGEGVRGYLEEIGAVTSLMVPILIEGRHWGLIGFDHRERQCQWEADDVKLLSTLARNAGRVVTHQQLLKEVWGTRFGTQTQYLHVYMGQLRGKLEAFRARQTEAARAMSAELK